MQWHANSPSLESKIQPKVWPLAVLNEALKAGPEGFNVGLNHLTTPLPPCLCVCCVCCTLQAMVVRGFLGPERHHLYLMQSNETSLLANVATLLLLGGLCALVGYVK